VFNGAEHHLRCLSGKKVLIVETPPGSVTASDVPQNSLRCNRRLRGLGEMVGGLITGPEDLGSILVIEETVLSLRYARERE
jgi:hypothetical protein